MMMKWLMAAAGGMFFCLTSMSALSAEPNAAELAAAQTAQNRGMDMFRYDQAAWHATDGFQADLGKAGKEADDPILALTGYIVEPTEGDRLLVTFYSGHGDVVRPRAQYTVDRDAHVEGGLLGLQSESQMSQLALRMIAARDAATALFQKPEHELCSESPPNTLVLPPDDGGVISVYILTSTTDAASYPAGGHYRFDVAKGGQIADERRFMKSCFAIDLAKTKGAEAVVLTHLIDRQPTEIHTFVNLNIGIPLMIVTTANKFIWDVVGGRISFVSELNDK